MSGPEIETKQRVGIGKTQRKPSSFETVRIRSFPSKPHQPLQHRIEIHLLLGRDPITADLPSGDAFQIHRINQLVDTQPFRQIGFVAQHQQGDTLEGFVSHKGVQLLLGLREQTRIGDVDDKDYRVDASAVALPHLPKARLATEIPAFERDMPALDTLEVESYCWNRAMCGVILVVEDKEGERGSGGDLMKYGMGPKRGGLLKGEFSALELVSKSFSYGRGGRHWRLTEITLSSDVFPAFCKPIMVTSISVALLYLICEQSMR